MEGDRLRVLPVGGRQGSGGGVHAYVLANCLAMEEAHPRFEGSEGGEGRWEGGGACSPLPRTAPTHPNTDYDTQSTTCTYIFHGRVVSPSMGNDLCRLQAHVIFVLGMLLILFSRREQGRPKEGRQEEGACSRT